MKKILKKHYFVTILLFLVALKIPNLFEGHWYGDEGIYAAVADGFADGKNLYKDIWDHKPPLILWIYGLFQNIDWELGYIFIKTLGIIVSGFALYSFDKIFDLLKLNFKSKIFGLIFTTILIGTNIFEGNIANAEIFMLPLSLIGIIQIFKNKPNYLVFGIIMALGLMLKMHIFIEIIVLVALSLILTFRSENRLKKIFEPIKQFSIAFITIMILICLNFVAKGSFFDFVNGAFLQNIIYSDSNFHPDNFIGNYHSIIISVIFLAVFFISFVFFLKKKLAQNTFIILNILSAEIFASLLSGRNYLHYFYQIIPGIVIIASIFFDILFIKKGKIQFDKYLFYPLLLMLIYALVFFNGPKISNYAPSYNYYQSFLLSYLFGDSSEKFYWNKNDAIKRNLILQDYIISQNLQDKTVYIYTNDAWIFANLPNTKTNKFVVYYHLTFRDEFLQEELKNIAKADMVIYDTKTGTIDAVKATLNSRILIDEFEGFEIYLN